jgi:carboxylesterase
VKQLIPVLLLGLFARNLPAALPSEYGQSCQTIQSWIQADQGLLGGNRPILLVHGHPTDTAVVLLHGFSASPFECADLATNLYDAGYNVVVPRLAGHGGSRAEFESFEWNDWLASARKGLDAGRGLGSRLVLAGHSGGGVLASLLAVQQSGSLAGLVLAAPAYRLADWRSEYTIYAPVRWVAPDVHYEVKNEDQRLHWQNDYSAHAVAQLVLAARRARKELSKLELPVLMLQASDDPAVSTEAGEKYFKRIGSRDKQLIIFPSHEHNVLTKTNPRQAECFAAIRDFIQAHSK